MTADFQWSKFGVNWGSRSYVMGIINVTPDSFSGDGLAKTPDEAMWPELAAAQAQRFIAEGVDCLDIGAVSTRPKAPEVSYDTERRRLIPAVKAVAAAVSKKIPISIDTTDSRIAQEAIECGASIINDISGLQGDPAMAKVAAQAHCGVVIMANLRKERHASVMNDVTRFLAKSLDIAYQAGIAQEQISIDPGFGFGPLPSENITMIRMLETLKVFGAPIIFGASRKSTLSKLLAGAPPADLLEASLAAAVAAILHGADMVRVHDVAATVKARVIADAIRFGL